MDELNVILCSCKGLTISTRGNIRNYMMGNLNFRLIFFTNHIIKRDNKEITLLEDYIFVKRFKSFATGSTPDEESESSSWLNMKSSSDENRRTIKI